MRQREPYLLYVGGFRFKPYFEILKNLKIKTIIKTDNDLRKIHGKNEYSLLGFARVNDYIGKKILPVTPINGNSVEDKRNLYDKNKEKLDEIREKNFIYLSRCSLEEDLDEVIHCEMVKYLSEAGENVIKYLQEAKNINMVKLAEKLSADDCKKIFEHYNFACLKEVIQ